MNNKRKKNFLFLTQVLIPVIISSVMVLVAQSLRIFYNFSVFPQLFVVPLIVLIILVFIVRLLRTVSTISVRFEEYGNEKSSTNLNTFIKYTLVVLICIRVIGVVWGSNYLSPVFEAQYIAGKAHVDTLFHVAITNMLRFFGEPSIGVEGIIPLEYHFGSHFLMGIIARILNLPSLAAYHLVFPSLILPLWIGSFLILSEVVRSKYFPTVNSNLNEALALFLFYAAISGLLPDRVREDLAVWNNMIVSESYTFSLFFLYLFSSMCIVLYPDAKFSNNKNNHFIFLGVALIAGSVLTFMKISVGTLWCVGLFALWIRNVSDIKKLISFILSGIGWLLAIPHVYSPSGNVQGLSIGHFISQHVELTYLSYYPIVHYGWTVLAILMLQYNMRYNRISVDTGRSFQLVLVMIAFVGALPGLFLPIKGGSASYFSSVQVWISLPMLSVCIISVLSIESLKKHIFTRYSAFVPLMILSFTFLSTPLLNSFYTLYKFGDKSIGYMKTVVPESKEIWDTISEMHQDKERPVAINYSMVPPYGDKGNNSLRTWMRAYLSSAAIAGIPTVNEVEPHIQELAEEKIGWGFDKLLRNQVSEKSIEMFSMIEIRNKQGKLSIVSK